MTKTKTTISLKAAIGSFGILIFLTACQPKQNSTSVSSESVKMASLMSMEASKGAVISGPEIVVLGQTVSFTLASQTGSPITQATWAFNDDTAPVSALDSVTHSYILSGIHTIFVTAYDSTGTRVQATHDVNVIGYYDGLDCIPQTTANVPAQAYVGVPMTVSAFIPDCFKSSVTSVQWNFGDGNVGTGTTATDTYTTAGTYTVVMQIISPFDEYEPFITLTRQVQVSAAPPSPTPTPNPLACPSEGATRESMIGDEYDQTKACGTGGTETDKYKIKLVEACQVQDGTLMWTEVSRTPVLQSQGECLKQSCSLPDGSTLADGQSRTMYSSQTPAGSCTEASTTRTCTNGVLSGSSSYSQLVCHNACDGFGPHGTVKTGVDIGTTAVAKECSFGEQGITDTYQQLVDQTCTDGSVTNSNARTGSLVTAGVCPTYSYVATDSWTQCDADCGGHQTRIFECRNDKGESAPADRCAGQAVPTETRICDGNPDAVARTESSSKDEEAGNVGSCPKNQLGVVINTRTTTTTTAYACIDHSVQVASVTTTSTPWVQESYCRDYVAHRCSQDSLSNSDAQGRYEWMLKCQDQVPVIKEFLTEFDNVKAAGNYTIDGSGRHVYPTFMNRATNPEKPWIAPKAKTASCNVPSTAYVAAVCLSSCATPEQEIIAQAEANAKLRKVPFIDALLQNYQFVGTLKSQSPINSMEIKKTKVDQWVTELIDTDHDILHFHTRSGGSLRVTPNHPMIATDGTVRMADQFKVGDSLVRLGGHADEIVAIDSEVHFGKVYNVFVHSAAPAENVVVTSGFLNGTAFFQNEGATNMNREILRNKLTRGAFGQ